MAEVFVLTSVHLGLAARGDTWGQRAVTGGGIGSGALIGGTVDAGVGAATTPTR